MSKADISKQISIDAKVSDKPTTARLAAKKQEGKAGASKTPLGSHYKHYH